jgi:hypothetical protein
LWPYPTHQALTQLRCYGFVRTAVFQHVNHMEWIFGRKCQIISSRMTIPCKRILQKEGIWTVRPEGLDVAKRRVLFPQ